MHGAHLTGWVEKYINADPSNADTFDRKFLCFINSAKESSEDIDHVFSTLSSYFSSKKRGLLSKSVLFDCGSSEGRIAVLNYIRRIEDKGLLERVKKDILVHANFISSKGFCFIKDALEG